MKKFIYPFLILLFSGICQFGFSQITGIWSSRPVMELRENNMFVDLTFKTTSGKDLVFIEEKLNKTDGLEKFNIQKTGANELTIELYFFKNADSRMIKWLYQNLHIKTFEFKGNSLTMDDFDDAIVVEKK